MLTEKEIKLSTMLGQCMTLFDEIADETGLLQADKVEFCNHIHDLQNAVMAQAARRLHPKDFR